jgi:hypothetical protein
MPPQAPQSHDSEHLKKLLEKNNFVPPQEMEATAREEREKAARRQEREWKRNNGGILYADHVRRERLESELRDVKRAMRSAREELLDSPLVRFLPPVRPDPRLDLLKKYSDRPEAELQRVIEDAFAARRSIVALEEQIFTKEDEVRRIKPRYDAERLELASIVLAEEEQKRDAAAANAQKVKEGIDRYEAVKTAWAEVDALKKQAALTPEQREHLTQQERQLAKLRTQAGNPEKDDVDRYLAAMRRRASVFEEERTKLDEKVKAAQERVKELQAPRAAPRATPEDKQRIAALEKEIAGLRKEKAKLAGRADVAVKDVLPRGDEADAPFLEAFLRQQYDGLRTSRFFAENALGNTRVEAIGNNLAADNPGMRLKLTSDGREALITSPDIPQFSRIDVDYPATLTSILAGGDRLEFRGPVAATAIKMPYGSKELTLADGVEVDLTRFGVSDRASDHYLDARGGRKYLLSNETGARKFNLILHETGRQPIAISIPADTKLKTSDFVLDKHEVRMNLQGQVSILIEGFDSDADRFYKKPIDVDLEIRQEGLTARQIPLVRRGVVQFKNEEELLRRIEHDKKEQNKEHALRVHTWLEENLKKAPADQVSLGHIERFTHRLLEGLPEAEKQKFEKSIETARKQSDEKIETVSAAAQALAPRQSVFEAYTKVTQQVLASYIQHHPDGLALLKTLDESIEPGANVKPSARLPDSRQAMSAIGRQASQAAGEAARTIVDAMTHPDVMKGLPPANKTGPTPQQPGH